MRLPLPPRPARLLLPTSLAAVLVCALTLCGPAFAEPGEEVYQAKCASCHGQDGQGSVDGLDVPLFGDYTVDELAEVVERTMPEGEPEACVGAEARQVARYMYDAFYSLEARQRLGLAPAPRVELSRLTVGQYRNAVADLILRFTPPPQEQDQRSGRRGRGRGRRQDERRAARVDRPSGPQPGLRAEYFQSKGMNKADELWEQRVDRRIDFDFDRYSPAEGITADQFAIVWEGALHTHETGHYEFRVRTQNGARLYLNSDPPESRRKLRDDSSVAGQAALIDGWVSSGEMRELSARVFLLGGRTYPLRLEFFKYLEETASIRLEWKPPHGTWSVLDGRYLTTEPARRVFVVDVPFPADDRSLGYERGSSVSREWHEATTSAAVATAAEVVNRLPLLAGFDPEEVPEALPDEEGEGFGRDALLKDFVTKLATAAFRRPLTSDEIQFFRTVPFADAANPDAAVRRAILLILKSPHFLYTDLTPTGEPPTQHAVASRLAFALWDSIPDEALLEAADRGQLATCEQIEAQARRMLADHRARAKMRNFFHHWLEVEERDLSKDKAMFPEFGEDVIADLRYSLELFLEEVLWSDASDYRELLQADYLFLNERLCGLYGDECLDACDADEGADDMDSEAVAQADTEPAASSEFRRVAFPAERRAGLLTHPYLLSAFAYHNNTSPIHRGVFLTRNVVGRPLKPPPVAVSFKDDEFAPDLTMREKITHLTRDQACMSCHSVINPLGFALENFDAVGRWRTRDNDKPIDTKSRYTTLDGRTLDVAGARDIANFAAQSEPAHRAFVTQMFHHLVKQNPASYGADTIDRFREEFAEDAFHMQNLMVRIASVAAAYGEEPPEGGGREPD